MKIIKISKDRKRDLLVGIFIITVGIALVISAILVSTSSEANSSRKEVKLYIISPKGYSVCNLKKLDKVKEGFFAYPKGASCFRRRKGAVKRSKYIPLP